MLFLKYDFLPPELLSEKPIEVSSNFPDDIILLICSLNVACFTPNNSFICFCVSQTVSNSGLNSTSRFMKILAFTATVPFGAYKIPSSAIPVTFRIESWINRNLTGLTTHPWLGAQLLFFHVSFPFQNSSSSSISSSG